MYMVKRDLYPATLTDQALVNKAFSERQNRFRAFISLCVLILVFFGFCTTINLQNTFMF